MNIIKRLIERIYEIYQLRWMMDHEKSIMDVLRVISVGYAESVASDPYNVSIDDGVDYFNDMGFGGEMYVCLDEFLGAEFCEPEYIKSLLGEITGGEHLLKEYMKFFGNFYEEKAWSKNMITELDYLIGEDMHEKNVQTITQLTGRYRNNIFDIEDIYEKCHLDIDDWR